MSTNPSTMMQIDIALGALVGALNGAAGVAGDYQGAFHRQALAAFTCQQDLAHQSDLLELAHIDGFDPDSVLACYLHHRDTGAAPGPAMLRTRNDMIAAREQ